MNGIRTILSGISVAVALTRCGPKETYPVLVPIGFFLPVTIMPSSRTMQRGDTLWLEMNCSDSLRDRHSGRRFRVRPQDAAFTYGILFKKLAGVGQPTTGVASTFRLIEKVGKASINGTFSGVFTPTYDGHYYRAKIGLVPTQAGITAISMLITPAGGAKALGTFIPFIQLPVDAQGREQKATFDESFFVINQGQANNFDLYSQNTRAFALEPGTHPDQVIYEQQSTFTVEVK